MTIAPSLLLSILLLRECNICSTNVKEIIFKMKYKQSSTNIISYYCGCMMGNSFLFPGNVNLSIKNCFGPCQAP